MGKPDRGIIDATGSVGWPVAQLGDVVDHLVDGSHNPPPRQTSGHLMLSAQNVEDGRILLDPARFISQADFEREDMRTRVGPGAVLLTIVGAIGRSAVVPDTAPRFALQRSVAVLRSRRLLPAFLSYQLRGPACQQYFEENARGTAQEGVYLRTLAQTPLVVPSIHEQRRIVAKIDELLAHVNAAREHLARVPAILKRFRQSVLAVAFSGRLSEAWRCQRGLYGAPEAGAKDLPEGWVSASLSDVAELVSGAGFPLEFQGKQGLAYPFFKVGNLGEVGSGESLVSAPDTVDAQLARELHARIIPAGAVLFAKIGMAIRLNRRRAAGVCCCIDNNMMAAIPSDIVLPRYLLRYLEAVDFLSLTQATTVPSLRKGDVAAVEVPVPPVDEQQEIIRRVEALFALADSIEQGVATATARAARLTQAILAKAFRGELVPTAAELQRAGTGRC